MADVKREMAVLVQLLKTSILCSTGFQLDNPFCGVVSAAEKQLGSKTTMVAQGNGKFGPEADIPESFQPKNNELRMHVCYTKMSENI